MIHVTKHDKIFAALNVHSLLMYLKKNYTQWNKASNLIVCKG